MSEELNAPDEWFRIPADEEPPSDYQSYYESLGVPPGEQPPHHYGLLWKRLLAENDRPMDPLSVFRGAAAVPVAEDSESASEAADMLLDEAVADKKWTIPWGAIVQLKVGPFSHFRLYEIGGNIICAGCNVQDESFLWRICPCTHELYYDSAWERVTVTSADVDSWVSRKAAIKLLLSAIIRDFWVLEEREAVFDQSRERQQRSGQRVHSDVPRIVYLPRIRYKTTPRVDKCATLLAHWERRAHFVHAHLRRLALDREASDYQQILATRYGFIIPSGHTFVRPHHRGKSRGDVVYRSRSALRSLYTIVDELKAGEMRVAWFQFERDVYELMRALGFEVEHVAASRNGDRGVDVYATKGQDFDQVTWIIQCKCRHPKRSLGPQYVRELRGALCEHPHGTRGMIAATCGFSGKAVELAASADIRLLDGQEFADLLAKICGKAT